MFIILLFVGLFVNRFGCKKVFLIGDFLLWCVYVYIFFFVKDFIWFLIVIIFNGFMRIFEFVW